MNYLFGAAGAALGAAGGAAVIVPLDEVLGIVGAAGVAVPPHDPQVLHVPQVVQLLL